MAKITINGISVDPDAQKNIMSVTGLISPDSSTSNYILIQTTQPLNRDQKNQLAELGVQILEFVPENTYICRYEPANLDAIRNLPFVEWANVYLEDFKIEPRLRTSAAANVDKANLFALGSIENTISRQPKRVTVVFHNNVSNNNNLRERITAAARLNPEDVQITGNSVKLSVQPQYLEDLAKVDEVRHIEEFVPRHLFNNVAIGILNAYKTHNTVNLLGENQVVAVADTGFDKGSMTDVHPAFTDRVIKLYPLGRSTANDPDGHGTHVAGSILGDGKSPAMGGSIQGTAPKAKLVLQSVLDSTGNLGGLPDDLNNLFKVPYENDGSRVHTNSWGASTHGRYTVDSRQVDQFVWEHRDIVICFSAGNDGVDINGNGVIDNGSVGAPGTAKNCITVGATENNRPEQSKPYNILSHFSIEPIASDGWSNNPEGMAAFSSRGPTQNERIKPDVVAPGTAILSAHSRDANINSFFGKSLDPLYAFLAGTSMATPLVAGCAAVVREYFQTQHNHQPSAALVKAMLINGAKDLSGQYVPSEAGEIPNFSEGFGRVDLAATVGPRGENERVIFQDENTELDTGEEEKIEVEVSETDSFVKVTLVWTDFPGEALQNDLDLIVRTMNGQERHGNMPPSSIKFDRRNNVEQVVWNDFSAGKVEIVVRVHQNIRPQSYALVVRIA